MSGGNGLHPVVNLTERQKCPAHPTKRKYSDGAEAGRAAQKSSKQSGLDIAPYLCSDCGYYHLTKRVGGDTIQLPDGKFSVGEFKAPAPDHPAFGNAEKEAPIMPGDHATRVRFVQEYLRQNPEPTSEELCEALGGCTKDTLRRVMRDLNYRNTRGRHARWVKNDNSEPEAIEEETVPEPDAPAPRHVNVERLRHIPVGDLIEAYAAMGMRLVLTLEDDHA